MPPVKLASAGKRDRAGQRMALPEKKRRCSALRRGRAACRTAAAAAHDAVAADRPIVAAMLTPWPREFGRDLRASVEPRFHRSFIDIRLHARYATPAASSICAPDRAGRSEDQGQPNNLVEKQGRSLARTWGRSQRECDSHGRRKSPRIHPRGSNPSPACESWVDSRDSRAFGRMRKRQLLANRDARLSPALPLPTTSSIL
jgi:hypothetical protein